MSTKSDPTSFGVVLERWLTDPGFREELRRAPEAAVAQLGVTLDADQWAALRRQLELSDDQIQANISKGLQGN
jgi:hypothetical protein